MHLTYRNSKPHTSEVSAAKAEEAGAPEDRSRFSNEELDEIEVTPAMIEAGIEEYGLFDWGDPGEWVVPAIYRGMELQRRRDAKAAAAASRSQPKSRGGAC